MEGWQPIRIGEKVINLALVTDVDLQGEYVSVLQAVSDGEGGQLKLRFRGEEAAALRWYLAMQAEDIVAAHLQVQAREQARIDCPQGRHVWVESDFAGQMCCQWCGVWKAEFTEEPEQVRGSIPCAECGTPILDDGHQYCTVCSEARNRKPVPAFTIRLPEDVR